MENLLAEIASLKKDRRAVILAHNYTGSDVQDSADFTGDSLELARKAASVEADVIVFCGVYFMAETAAILNPDKTVLIPDASAGCPMADMITGEQLRALKARHPGALAVCYVNSTAEVKAECDICVTSGNAERVMASLPPDREILFVPDQHLGTHVSQKLGTRYTLWPGYCPIHAALTVGHLAAARAAHPGAPVLVHPECPQDVRACADACLSTGGMCAHVRTAPEKTFIVGTETGILHRLRTENPDKTFHAAAPLTCADMKKITLEKVRDCLRDLTPVVTVAPDIAARAKRAIDAMLAL